MARTVWHTDIVVRGQGRSLKISPAPSGCYRVELKPDTPGSRASRAKKEFLEAARAGRTCFRTAAAAKGHVERGVARTRARWNRWHRESY